MGNLSEDEGSSSDSSNEFLVPADKIDLSSSFFQDTKAKKPPPNPSKKKPKASSKPAAVSRLESSSDDEEFDENQVSSAELLSQVLKNLENANKRYLPQQNEAGKSDEAASSTSAPVNDNKEVDLSKEINDLLMMGESQASTSKADAGQHEVKQEDSKEDVNEYAIPEKGVQIHLPGESFAFDKKKKKQQDLQKMLQNKINNRIRKTQVFAHKVGLLCGLAHGFHLNRLANDPDLLGITLSLVSPQNYPKGRPDLKYLEKFTQWFVGLFQICEEHKPVVFSKDLLMQRISDKKIYNYVELILLYIATVRGMGIHCRLVVSLRPPRLKPRQDQLFKIPASNGEDEKKVKKEEDDEEESSAKKKAAKKPPAKSTKTTAPPKKKLKTKEQSVSPTKVVAENSREAMKAAIDAAKKKAAAILKGKSGGSLNNCKVVLERTKSGRDAKSAGKTAPPENSEKHNGDDEEKASASKKGGKKVGEGALKKNVTKAQNDEDSDDEGVSTAKKSPPNKRLRGGRSASTRAMKNAESDDDSDDEQATGNKGSKANGSNRRTGGRRAQNKTLGKSKDESEDSDDEKDKNKKKMSIARKLSLRVKENKVETKASSSKSTRGKAKAAGSGKKRKHSSDEEEFEEEVDSSSEFSAKDEEVSSEDDFSSDSEFEEKKPKKKKVSSSVVKKKTSASTSHKKLDKSIISKFAYKSNKNPRKVISSDEESADTEKGYNVWVEVFLESEESWISVSVLDHKIHCVSQLYKKANHPVLYIIAWNSEGTFKDVTRRYCPHWLTDTRKKRVEEKWWTETLSSWEEKKSAMSRAEDEQLLQRELEQPLPKTVSECKGHPLYVLQRHLLKFEALYPPDCVPLGHLKTGEAIYSRHCVHTLYSRETWVKRARVVKPAQEAYKIVKSMPKYDKLSGQKIKDQPLELFGKWQTTPYEPPEAKDGKVPRNEYGNVDLFKMCMLPKGCVYIDLPALNRIARKLNIDCAPACVGFNFGCRGALPAFQGFVVCQEYEDTLREAWEEEQVMAHKRATEKREKRIYGNWKKLIKGLLIREKLAAKYRFGDQEESAGEQDENDGEEKEEEEEEEEKSTKKKKPAAKKVPTVEASETKTRAKRGRAKQEPSNPKKKLKK